MSLRNRITGRTAGSSEARLDAYCRTHPGTQRDTVTELARMRALGLHINYDTALGQLLDAMEKFG